MKADRGSNSGQRESKHVPRFAPNFSVHVLPPETVCLYSEDRKFFLHGELYCALASAIGEGGKSFRQLFRGLEAKYPTDKIQEAFKRLLDRGFLLANAPAAPDIAAAYWASLGLLPQTAQQNLKDCRVRVQSLNVEGAAELEHALSRLGVRLAKRSADVTVTLVGDYLEGQLAEFNRQHLSEKSCWLLVQPSGIFPLVGPVFRPRKSACWTCLADRMTRNREVRDLLDRASVRRVAASPLAKRTVGQTGSELAAVEIAKAIASDFRTDLNDHIISLDLLGSTIARHYVPRRPQCPSCGRKELRDPSRVPAPVELAPGSKLVMTSGGYRTVSSWATVARFRKHVSPLTGVVSRLERMQADLPLNTNYLATHNFSWRPESVDELRRGLSGGSFGKGSTSEQGEASALMEAVERYSGIFQGDEIRSLHRFTDLAAGGAIAPNDILLFSEAQSAPGEGPQPWSGGAPAAAFDPSAKIEWSPVWSLREQRFKFVPTTLLYFFYRGPGPYRVHADSNGCAAGNTLEEAIVQGFLELVERDAYAVWWYNRLQRPELELDAFDDAYIRDLKRELAATGRRVWVLDITNDLGVPSFVALTHWTDGGQEFVEFGSGSHFDSRIALLRALTELNQFLSIGLIGGRSANPTSESSPQDAGHDEGPPFRLDQHPYLLPNGKSAPSPVASSNVGSNFGALDTREQVMACVKLADREGLDFLVLDQTRADIEVPVVRVIVPGLRHFYRRFAPGRLYDVPVKLGWLKEPLAEAELNPLHPQT
jgi:bacteriocin biosynthesis cyclodehydratase domain-containing protein